MPNTSMPELIMLCGVPTSGKSTYVEKLKKMKYWENSVVLSTDDYIEKESKRVYFLLNFSPFIKYKGA